MVLDLDKISKSSWSKQDQLDQDRYDAKMEMLSGERRCGDCGEFMDDCTCEKDLDPEDEWEDDMED